MLKFGGQWVGCKVRCLIFGELSSTPELPRVSVKCREEVHLIPVRAKTVRDLVSSYSGGYVPHETILAVRCNAEWRGGQCDFHDLSLA